MKYYTGVGSRKCPNNILQSIQTIAQALAERNFTLRSGGADGADTAFEKGCDSVKGPKQIFLPWKNFNNNKSQLFNIPKMAFEISEHISPHLKYVNRPIKQLMARNCQQVLGPNLDIPSEFVICWTPDGCTTAKKRTKHTGGTGQAIALADTVNIPVYNLHIHSSEYIMEQINALY